MEIGKRFCRECGSELVEHFSGRYDEYTGEKIIKKHCPNLKCEEGCDFDGHQYTRNPFAIPKCLRCGYVPPMYP